MIAVIKKKDVYEPSYRLNLTVYMKFIEKNSDMDWNRVHDWIFESEQAKGRFKRDEGFQDLKKDLLELHGIDMEAMLSKTLKEEIDKEIAKTIELNTLSLEGRVEKMKSMLEADIPDFLRKDILANLLTVMEKKIRKDYCE